MLHADVSSHTPIETEKIEKLYIKDQEYKIVVTGHQHIGTTYILEAAQLAISYNNKEMIQNIIDQLMETGHFKSVEVTIENDIIHIDVIENTFIKQIKYEGLRLSQMLQGTNIEDITGLHSYQLISTKAIEAGIAKLTNILSDQGGMFTDVTYYVNDQSELIITINTSYTSLVTELEFSNNKFFTSGELLSSLPMYSILSGLSVSTTALQHVVVSHIIQKYKESGFLNCQVTAIKLVPIDNLNNTKAIMIIDEGERFLIDNCSLNFSKEIDKTMMNKVIAIFNDYRSKDNRIKWKYLNEFIQNLSTELMEQADFFTLVYNMKKQENNKADLSITVKHKVMCINTIQVKTSIIDQNRILKILKIHPGQYTTKYYLDKACRLARSLECISNITFEFKKLADDSNLYDLVLTVEENHTLKLNPFRGGMPKRPGASNKSTFSWNPFLMISNQFNTRVLNFSPAISWKNFRGTGDTFVFSSINDIMQLKNSSITFKYAIDKINTFDNIGKSFSYSKAAETTRFTGYSHVVTDRSKANPENKNFFDRLYEYFYNTSQLTAAELNQKPVVSILKTTHSSMQALFNFTAFRLPCEIGIQFSTSKNTELTATATTYNVLETNDKGDISDTYTYAFGTGNKDSATNIKGNRGEQIAQIDNTLKIAEEAGLMVSKNLLLIDMEVAIKTDYMKTLYGKLLIFTPHIVATMYSLKAQANLTFISYIGQDNRIVADISAGRVWLHDSFNDLANKFGIHMYGRQKYGEELKKHAGRTYLFNRMGYGPYSTDLDSPIGGQNMLKVNLRYIWKWHVISDFADTRLFAGITLGSCWGHYLPSDKILNANFRFRTTVYFGVVITLPVVGRIQVSLQVPLSNIKIYGYNFGHDVRYDSISFFDIGPADAD